MAHGECHLSYAISRRATYAAPVPSVDWSSAAKNHRARGSRAKRSSVAFKLGAA
jgi:hypothetical protein